MSSSPFHIKAAPKGSASTSSLISMPTTSLSATNASAAIDSTSRGLSTGAKAGIGAGVGFTAIVLVAALLLFLSTKRSRAHAQNWFDQRTNPEKGLISDHQARCLHGYHQHPGRSPPYEAIPQTEKLGEPSPGPRLNKPGGHDLMSEIHAER